MIMNTSLVVNRHDNKGVHSEQNWKSACCGVPCQTTVPCCCRRKKVPIKGNKYIGLPAYNGRHGQPVLPSYENTAPSYLHRYHYRHWNIPVTYIHVYQHLAPTIDPYFERNHDARTTPHFQVSPLQNHMLVIPQFVIIFQLRYGMGTKSMSYKNRIIQSRLSLQQQHPNQLHLLFC